MLISLDKKELHHLEPGVRVGRSYSPGIPGQNKVVPSYQYCVGVLFPNFSANPCWYPAQRGFHQHWIKVVGQYASWMLRMAATCEQPLQYHLSFFPELWLDFPKPESLSLDPSCIILECKESLNSVVIVNIPQIALIEQKILVWILPQIRK